MQQLMQEAKKQGFSEVAVMKVADLVVVPEYRKYCAENRCGCYGAVSACPPASGTVEAMEARMRAYDTALVLCSTVTPVDPLDKAEQKADKARQNERTERLMEIMRQQGRQDLLMMSAGPWKDSSCMSAYCVDAQKMADSVHMTCWADDGKIRYFSLVLFHSS